MLLLLLLLRQRRLLVRGVRVRGRRLMLGARQLGPLLLRLLRGGGLVLRSRVLRRLVLHCRVMLRGALLMRLGCRRLWRRGVPAEGRPGWVRLGQVGSGWVRSNQVRLRGSQVSGQCAM